jgi:hypothetical protein
VKREPLLRIWEIWENHLKNGGFNGNKHEKMMGKSSITEGYGMKSSVDAFIDGSIFCK